MNTRSLVRRFTPLIAVLVLVMAMVSPALAQRGFGRGGSFGGGRSTMGGSGFGRSGSFGGSSFGRSSSGSSFGRSSSGSSFGRSSGSGGFGRTGSYGGFGGSSRPSSPGFGSTTRSSGSVRAPGSSSFGRSGAFGGSGRVNSTSLNRTYAPRTYRGQTYYEPAGSYYYGGRYVPGFGTGLFAGYSLGILTSPWTHYVPFHPGFYVHAPVYDPVTGAYYGGGFSFTRLIVGILVIAGVIWLVSRLFRGGGGGRIRYTTYK